MIKQPKRRNFSYLANLVLTLSIVAIPGWLFAETLIVSEGESIQSAIAAASDGDTIEVGPGTYVENINFMGKAISVVGSGDSTVIDGNGQGTVVTFNSGEGPNSILDSVRVTGGQATNGGGIYVLNSSPTIVRNRVIRNRAVSTGSGICVSGFESRPLILNNVIARNSVSNGGGDPHGIQILSSSPTVVNNTITLNDSNGIFITGNSNSTIMNNIIARNGTIRRGNPVKGRGICEFGGTSTIRYNLFFQNAISAFLNSNRRDFVSIRRTQRAFRDVRVSNNRDGNPRFRRARRDDFNIRRRSRGRNRGNPEAGFNDGDSTRNDIGVSGGPSAP